MPKRFFTALLWIILIGVPVGYAKTYIVSVGINNYSNFPSKIDNLVLPVNDAKDVYSLFSASNAEKLLIIDSKATKSNILAGMKNIFGKAGKDDTVVFYFSGHGYPGGFCAADGKLPYSDIRKAMASSKATKKLIFADACNSGALRVDAKLASKQTDKAKKANVMMFLASRNNESSIENRAMRNGYFTHHLLRGLKGNADANNDKVVTAKEIYDYVHANVPKSTRNKQHPVMWGNFDNNMSIVKLK